MRHLLMPVEEDEGGQYHETIPQAQSLRTTHLIRQYSSLEEELSHIATPQQRRRLRRQLSLVRARLSDAGGQERALLVRLGELCVELRNHETWEQVQRERAAAAASCQADTPPCPLSQVSDVVHLA